MFLLCVAICCQATAGATTRKFVLFREFAADWTNNGLAEYGYCTMGLQFSVLMILPYNDSLSYADVNVVGPAVDMAMADAKSSSLSGCDVKVIVTRHDFQHSCDMMAQHIAAVVAQMYYSHESSEYPLAAVTGTTCHFADLQLLSLTTNWNLLTLLGSGSVSDIDDRKIYPTAVEFSFSHSRMGQFIGQILQKYNWTDFGIIYSASAERNEDVRRLQKHIQKVTPARIQLVPLRYRNIKEQYRRAVNDAHRICRVALVLDDLNGIRQVMLAAYHSGFTNGDHVYIAISYLGTKEYFGLAHWNQGETDDSEARSAFQRLFVIRESLPDSMEMAQFHHNLTEEAIARGTPIRHPDEINIHAVPFYNAITAYGTIVNETWLEGENIFDGRNMAHRFKNRTFAAFPGNFTFHENASSIVGNFDLWSFEWSTGNFTKIIEFWDGDSTVRPVNSIVWPLMPWPPPNEPVCGFDGLRPACFFYEHQTSLISIITAVIIAGIVIGLIIAIRRHRQNKAKINARWWKISPDELSKPERGADGTHAMYRFETVHLEPIAQCALTKKCENELAKLRAIKAYKLVRIYGICSSPESQVLVLEYCSRGNLFYLTRHADPFLCDWNFKFSALKDVAEALTYIHGSWIQSHGRLRSDKCLLNAQFTCKITDYVLQDMIPEDNLEPEKKLWTAPELLRKRPEEVTVLDKKRADIYSLAIIMTEVAMLVDPFANTNSSMPAADMVKAVAKIQPKPFRPRLKLTGLGQQSAELKEIIENSWQEEPEKRSTAPKVLGQLKALAGEQGTQMLLDLLTRLTKHAEDLEKRCIQMTKDYVQQKADIKALLCDVLPRSVGLRMFAREKILPEYYEAVTLLFASIENITDLAVVARAADLIDCLNDWQKIVRDGLPEYNLTKVTIYNDVWMIAGGCPYRNGFRHVANTAQYALYLRQASAGLQVTREEDWLPEEARILIGFHTGPVVACITGTRLPRYYLIGETVRIAHTVHMTSESGKIQISKHTAALLDETKMYKSELRGKIFIQDRRLLTTYWLNGIKSEIFF